MKAQPIAVGCEVHVAVHLAAFMHRGLIVGAFRRIGGFFEKPAPCDLRRRFSPAEVS